MTQTLPEQGQPLIDDLLDHPFGHLVPEGRRWGLVRNCGPFVDLIGPAFMTQDGLEEGEPARLGLRIEARHTNGMDVCHGGFLATFLDLSMARGLLAAGGITITVPTVSMTLDYLAPASLGEWLESRVKILHRTRRMAFVQAMLVSNDAPVIRGSGVFRITPRP